MSIAEGSSEGGWLNWLTRRNKPKRSDASSYRPLQASSDMLLTAALSKNPERIARQEAPADDLSLALTGSPEIVVEPTMQEMASAAALSRSLPGEDGDSSSATNLIEFPALAAVAVTAAENGPAALVAELSEGAAYTLIFTPSQVPFSIPQGLEHALVTDETGLTALRIAKGAESAPSGGTTGGYSVRVPDELEKLASGRAIKLRLLARSIDDAKGRIACAYSTNEVGNSGWRWLSFGPQWEIKSFGFKVPPMKNGRGDFVGLLPPPESEPVTEIIGLAIEVV